MTGHHFAGFSNRFWTLLFESGLVPERVRREDDDRLPEWGYGVTNLIARPDAGHRHAAADEYIAGARVLRRKVRRVEAAGRGAGRRHAVPVALPEAAARTPPAVGLRDEPFEGARVFVLPNPSGRNANYSYAEMLEAFTELRRYLASVIGIRNMELGIRGSQSSSIPSS